MKIYSDTLVYRDLCLALPMGVYIADVSPISNPRTKNESTGMPYERGWNIYLEGTSCHVSQHDRYNKAATWDEWGVWMAELYRLDPQVKIGWYKSYEYFIEQTTRTRNYYANRNSMVAREHRAPWLDDCSEKLGEDGTVRIMAPSGY